MPAQNTENSYGSVAKFFHWTIALIVIALLAVGLYMGGMENSPLKFQVYGIHKSFGFLVLWLVGLRLAWKFYNEAPELLSKKRWERNLARLTHFLLYVCLVLQPLSGWIMSSASGRASPLIFGFDLPAIVQPDRDIGGLFHEVHEYTGFILIGLIALHFAGAIKHHFVDGDQTLLRMLPFGSAKD
tara:strand:- start:1649 stop:2203 length:555 start_codon:yes stop_codon:yes gene_type:complete